MLREGAPVTERLLRSLRGTASCVGDGVALRPYTVPASLALVPSALPRLSIRPSAEARGPVYLSSRHASCHSALEHAHAGSVYGPLSFRKYGKGTRRKGKQALSSMKWQGSAARHAHHRCPLRRPSAWYASGSRKRSADGGARAGWRAGHHSVAGGAAAAARRCSSRCTRVLAASPTAACACAGAALVPGAPSGSVTAGASLAAFCGLSSSAASGA